MKNLILPFLIAAVLVSGITLQPLAFADSDDDQHEGKVNKKNRVWTGDGPPAPKLGKVGDLYIDNHDATYNIYKKTGKFTWTDVTDIAGTPGPAGPPGQPGPQGQQGQDGAPGQNGQDGVSCWDTNGDRHSDPSEDINNDGLYNGLDCTGPQGEPGQNANTEDLQNQINSLILQIIQLNGRIQTIEETLCNDNNPLTSDVIDPQTNQCVNPLINCSDNDPATSDAYNPTTEQCVNLNCDDGDASTFDILSTSTFQCEHLPIPNCDDGNPYTIDSYDASTNTCSSVPVPDGTPCDDGNPNTTDVVVGGVCVGQPTDADFDGFPLPVDCNDSNPAINPFATEVFNGVDDNCNGSIDEGVTDNDGDGFVMEIDCDDFNATIYPGAAESANGLDDNCNGIVDEGVIDNDSDGYFAEVDCNDNDATVNPGASEVVGDGIDNNCNGLVDEDNVVFFEEDFDDNSQGWTLGSTWQIGSASPSVGQNYGNPDPAEDHTPTSDNGVAGVIIGGNAPLPVHPYYYLTSPVIDTASQPTVYLEYYRWLNSDYTPYMANSVEVYDGSSWVVVWASGGSPGVTDSSWTKQVHDVTAYRNSDMQIRFGYLIGSGGVFTVSSWNLDDVKLVDTPSP